MRRHFPSPRTGAAARLLAVTACLAAGVLGGCSSSGHASEPSSDGAGAPEPEVPRPERGKALLYVIRGDEGVEPMEVKLTAGLLGAVAGREYVTTEVEPGNYVLGCFLTYIDRDPIHTFSTVRLTSGRSKYFLAKKVTGPPRPGAYTDQITIQIEELDPAEGERLLPTLHQVVLAEEAPASIPFHEGVAADEEPEPNPPREVAALPEQPEEAADDAGDLAAAEETAPPNDAGAEDEVEAEPEAVTSTASGLEPGAQGEPSVPEVSVDSAVAETAEPATGTEAPAQVEAREIVQEPPATTSRPKPVKLYKGPKLARSRVARLVMGDRVFVASINGIPHEIGPFGSDIAGIRLPTDAFRTSGVELKPGRYVVELEWHGPPITRKRTYFGTHKLEVELEAGMTYTVDGERDGNDVLGWKSRVVKEPRDPSN